MFIQLATMKYSRFILDYNNILANFLLSNDVSFSFVPLKNAVGICMVLWQLYDNVCANSEQIEASL